MLTEFTFNQAMLLAYCVAMGGCHGVSCDIMLCDIINHCSSLEEDHMAPWQPQDLKTGVLNVVVDFVMKTD